MTAEYLVSIAATNGQAGGFLHNKIAPVIADNDRVVLYLGDWDLQGHQIEANTKRVLEKAAGREIDWTRIAITEEQIGERRLTAVWKTDERYKRNNPKRNYQAWEAEALGQGTIQQLVREALDSLLPEPLGAVMEREEVQRERLATVLGTIDEAVS